ncbi:hypothetical protein BJ165DRAFT_1410853 [Panaeolus papilionaceus]|nr:hypothetical protein BJ165DRAFT_1410853 [Panaeolus papilionaceus]
MAGHGLCISLTLLRVGVAISEVPGARSAFAQMNGGDYWWLGGFNCGGGDKFGGLVWPFFRYGRSLWRTGVCLVWLTQGHPTRASEIENGEMQGCCTSQVWPKREGDIGNFGVAPM